MYKLVFKLNYATSTENSAQNQIKSFEFEDNANKNIISCLIILRTMTQGKEKSSIFMGID